MKIYLLTLVLLITTLNFYGQSRTLSGAILFTNDTPGNKDKFPVELFTSNGKTLVRSTKPDADGYFKISDIKAGKYLLKLTWYPGICVLRYRVDLRRGSKTRSTILMDAACGDNSRPPIRDLPD